MKEILEIIGISLISEDFSLIYGLTGVQSERMTGLQLIIAYVAGITLGDLGLFYCGRAGRLFPKGRFRSWVESKLSFVEKRQKGQGLTGIEKFLVITRFLPGSRIPTYVTLGFTGYSVLKFTAILALTSLFYVSTSVGLLKSLNIKGDLVWWQALLVAAGIYFLTLQVFKVLEFLFVNKRNLTEALKIKWYSLLRLRHYEFWPPNVFYIPIGIYIPIHMLRTFSFSGLLYTNPGVPYGGLIGETKASLQPWLDRLPKQHTLRSKSFSGSNGAKLLGFEKAIASSDLQFPVVMKPEEGQRGMGVQKIYDMEQAKQYITNSKNEVQVQELSAYENEVGLFFIRRPGSDKGSARLISATKKVFPFVVGDGQKTVGQLIMSDKRARLIAKIYKKQLQESWSYKPNQGELYKIAEYGNHARGTIFEDITASVSAGTQQKFSELISALPDYNIGRFDVRYKDEESFARGESFHIIEINGAGAEETHIYDRKHNMFYAQWVLFKQWGRLYDFGVLNQKSLPHIYRWKFIKKLLSSYYTAKNFSK